MPYINITEQDITPVASFDTIENAVLVFGFDFRKNFRNTSTETPPKYKLYTSLLEFIKDIKATGIMNDVDSTNIKVFNTNLDDPAYRSYVTAYDCLNNGLPVIYYPIDENIPDEAIHTVPEVKTYICYFTGIDEPQQYSEAAYNALPEDPEGIKYITTGEGSEEVKHPEDISKQQINIVPAKDFVLYEYFGRPESVPIVPETEEAYNASDCIWNKYFTFTQRDLAVECYNDYSSFTSEGYSQDFASDSMAEFTGDLSKYELADKINLPYSFITTCGYENYKRNAQVVGSIYAATNGRKDFVYLYDIPADITPESIVTDENIEIGDEYSELVNIVYPWAHYSTAVTSTEVHMPGSYGYLMAYAASIRNNKPWLAIAGINRGIIPNIKSVDYNISEPYLHAFQGELTLGDNPLSIRINPIVDFGPNFGKIIFGNRTNHLVTNSDIYSFRSFLNARLLLVYIHKQAFASSVQHMFEPNDDIVWLSFKQKVNTLLDQMVSGRGLRWYKWTKLRPDKLGQIKATLTIRPIEAVESFDITIIMTDTEVNIEY